MTRRLFLIASATVTALLLSACPAGSGYSGGGGGGGSDYWLHIYNDTANQLSIRECWYANDTEDDCLGTQPFFAAEMLDFEVTRAQYTYFRLWSSSSCAEATPSYDDETQYVSELTWASCDNFSWPDVD